MAQSANPSRGRKNSRASGASRKPRQRRRWLRTVLFFIFFPLIVWFLAFLIWFYWYNIVSLFGDKEPKTKAVPRIEAMPEHQEKLPPSKAPAEKILDEDRQKLEDILKRR
ncbi:MAG: hypothetical protein EXR70_13425 [Deltaproteobacteria bacterium]|nr:hypothetical protein [Deltaproteobacteria bacterium]